jgi:hypothetical protein
MRASRRPHGTIKAKQPLIWQLSRRKEGENIAGNRKYLQSQGIHQREEKKENPKKTEEAHLGSPNKHSRPGRNSTHTHTSFID